MLIGPGGTVYLNAKKKKKSVFVDSFRTPFFHRSHSIMRNKPSKKEFRFKVLTCDSKNWESINNACDSDISFEVIA